MYFPVRLTVLLMSLCAIARGQQGAPEVANPTAAEKKPEALPAVNPAANPDPNAEPVDVRQRPLTPQELREMQIRQFDPLDGQKSRAERPGSRDTTPLPGSIADSNKQSAKPSRGPKVVAEDDGTTPPAQDFAGPAVLSRAYTVNRPINPRDIKWQESFGLGSNFSSGTSGPPAEPGGTPTGSGNIYGSTINASLSGRRLFVHDQLGLVFTGQYQRSYPSYGIYNGPNLTLTMDYTHVISRRLSVTLGGTATRSSQNSTQQNTPIDPGTSAANVNIGSSPNIQIFDSTTKQVSTQVDFTWQKSERLSFNLGVGYFAIVRGSSLIGSAGEQARGDFNYRLTRKTTTGAYYTHGHYVFQTGAGTSNNDTAGLIYSYAFSRSMQLRFRGGLSRTESLGLTTVLLDPMIAQLLGRVSGVVDLYRSYKSTDISAQVVKDFRGERTVSIAYARGISPGNGVFQASSQETIAASGSMTMMRSYLVRLGGGRDSLSSVSQTLGKYVSENAQLSVGRSFRGGFGANLVLSYRYFDVKGLPVVRNQVFVSSGLTWSPAGGRLWPF
jgi:hypothetical protein